MNIDTSVPRVEIPGLTEDDKAQIEAVREELTHRQRTSALFLRALLAKGRPFTGIRKPAPKPTKHVRQMRNAAVRSYYLKSVAA